MKPTERKITKMLIQMAQLASQLYRFRVRIWFSTQPTTVQTTMATTKQIRPFVSWYRL
jgi:hypothetical protein